jgi:hypothetical protein
MEIESNIRYLKDEVVKIEFLKEKNSKGEIIYWYLFKDWENINNKKHGYLYNHILRCKLMYWIDYIIYFGLYFVRSDYKGAKK